MRRSASPSRKGWLGWLVLAGGVALAAACFDFNSDYAQCHLPGGRCNVTAPGDGGTDAGGSDSGATDSGQGSGQDSGVADGGTDSGTPDSGHSSPDGGWVLAARVYAPDAGTVTLDAVTGANAGYVWAGGGADLFIELNDFWVGQTETASVGVNSASYPFPQATGLWSPQQGILISVGVYHQSGASPPQWIIDQLTGSTWDLDTFNSQPNTYFNGVFVVDAGIAWAYGNELDRVVFNGTTASVPTEGVGANPFAPMLGVWGPGSDELWVVGNGGQIFHNPAVLDAGGWLQQNSGVSSSQSLYAIWGSNTTDIWAGGQSGTLTRYTGGTDWMPYAQGMTGATTDIHGIWGSGPSDVWFVCAGGDILHWNGGSFDAPVQVTPDDLLAVWGTSATDVWAVGDGGVVLHYFPQ